MRGGGGGTGALTWPGASGASLALPGIPSCRKSCCDSNLQLLRNRASLCSERPDENVLASGSVTVVICLVRSEVMAASLTSS